MRWQDYFNYAGRSGSYYYKNNKVVSLPHDIPMPPTDDFSQLFRGCRQLKDISALADWDVSNVMDMRAIFFECERLTDISALANWDVSKVKDMSSMFHGCLQLKDIAALSKWDISTVKDISYMFYGCDLLPHILQNNTSYMYTYISDSRYDTYQKTMNHQLSALQKENAELNDRLAYLEEKMGILISHSKLND